MAGKRKGKEDERHLWPEMLRAIREIKPKYIVGENVFGLLNWNGGLVFDEVHTDLELEGYEVQAVVIPAAAVNAPHGRDRVWFVAYSSCNANGLRTKGGMGMDGEILERRKGQKKANRFNDNCQNQDVADTNLPRCQTKRKQPNPTTQNERIEHSSSRWEQFPTQSPICGGDDGIPTELDRITFSKWRTEAIKGYGNAIVPQVAYEIFKVLQHIDDSLK